MKIPVTPLNAYVGMKVVRGKDWEYGYQDKDSNYGVITEIRGLEDSEAWVNVDWKFNDDTLRSNSYRIKAKQDLYIYRAEHALLSVGKPDHKYKQGEHVLICDRFKCNGYGWLSFTNRYYAIDSVAKESFKVDEIVWREDKKEWYYKKDGSGGYVAEHTLSLINNKKPENGTENNTSKEVQRSIEPISTREGPSGTIIQGRRSTAQIVSRPVKYETVIGRS